MSGLLLKSSPMNPTPPGSAAADVNGMCVKPLSIVPMAPSANVIGAFGTWFGKLRLNWNGNSAYVSNAEFSKPP